MVNLAKKLIVSLSDRNLRQALSLICLLSFVWSAVPAKAVENLSLGGLYTGPGLTADLTYQGAPLAAKPVVYGPKRPPTVRQVLLEVCQDRGYGEDCAKTLMGMAWKESRFDGLAVGDGGKARGFFQIHFKLHRVPLTCAQDLKCSAEWTLTYLEYNGYPKYPNYATQCHNGCNVANGYAAAVRRAGRRLWAAEDVLALAAKL